MEHGNDKQEEEDRNKDDKQEGIKIDDINACGYEEDDEEIELGESNDEKTQLENNNNDKESEAINLDVSVSEQIYAQSGKSKSALCALCIWLKRGKDPDNPTCDEKREDGDLMNINDFPWNIIALAKTSHPTMISFTMKSSIGQPSKISCHYP